MQAKQKQTFKDKKNSLTTFLQEKYGIAICAKWRAIKAIIAITNKSASETKKITIRSLGEKYFIERSFT